MQLPSQDEPRTLVKAMNLGDTDVRWIPCNARGRLPLSAVTAVFGEDVTALMTEVAGGWEVLLLEDGQFSPPGGGFANKTIVTVKAKARKKNYPTIKVE